MVLYQIRIVRENNESKTVFLNKSIHFLSRDDNFARYQNLMIIKIFLNCHFTKYPF